MSSHAQRDRTVVEILRDRATQQPQKIAYQFLKGGAVNQAIALTYGELHAQAMAIASHLIQHPSASRALLIYPYESGLEFIAAFFGCLYAGIVAVPCHPPRQDRDIADLKARFNSAHAVAILSIAELQSKLQPHFNASFYSTPNLTPNLAPNLTPSLAPHLKELVQSIPIVPELEAIAFLQYTSGSTGVPKGVIITHRCICAHQCMLADAFNSNESTINVAWLPLFHDMGLVGNVLQPMYLGVPSILMSPIAFVQKPLRWLEAIAHFRATTSGAPNFAYDLLCRHVTPEQRAKLDLSSWTVAFSGAEAVRSETIEQFASTFADCGFRQEAFYPCYGMAEATLFIAGGDSKTVPVQQVFDLKELRQNRVVCTELNPSSIDRRMLVSCGRVWGETELLIVDPETRVPCLPNQVGEIWVTGSGVSPGYWQLPEQTEATFQARPVTALITTAMYSNQGELNQTVGAIDTSDTSQPAGFLRTGDLGFFHDGNLYITGRLKEMLVFWGFNHYPQHLEQTVAACHPALQPNGGAAFAVTVAGEERLVIAQEVARRSRHSFLFADIVETIRWQLFLEHFVDVYAIALVKPNSLPRTTSGKLQRQLCCQQFLQGELSILDEWRSPSASDLTQLMGNYMNLVTQARRYWLKLRGMWRQRWGKNSGSWIK